jgi:hypothetical protein
MSTLPNETVSFKDYYRRFIKQFTKDLLRLGREQVIGALLAVAIFVLQFYFGLIPASQTRQAWESILWPYALLIVALCFLSAIRAPVEVDRDRHKEIENQAEEIGKLNKEKSQLGELIHPKVSPEEERRRKLVAIKIMRLDQNSKRVLRYIMDHGSIKSITLEVLSGFQPNDVTNAVAEGMASSLLISIGDAFEVNPQFRSSLDFVLGSEGL